MASQLLLIGLKLLFVGNWCRLQRRQDRLLIVVLLLVGLILYGHIFGWWHIIHYHLAARDRNLHFLLAPIIETRLQDLSWRGRLLCASHGLLALSTLLCKFFILQIEQYFNRCFNIVDNSYVANLLFVYQIHPLFLQLVGVEFFYLIVGPHFYSQV